MLNREFLSKILKNMNYYLGSLIKITKNKNNENFIVYNYVYTYVEMRFILT